MRVFLSYASEDRNQAEAIYLSLRGQGHTVFFDRTDLPPGEEYDARIRRGIERSQLLVADWFAEGFLRGDVRNPKGPESGKAKVIRGGGWYDPPDRLRSSRRMQASPGNLADDVGFRCAKDFTR